MGLALCAAASSADVGCCALDSRSHVHCIHTDLVQRSTSSAHLADALVLTCCRSIHAH
jgi:hypothetical protein